MAKPVLRLATSEDVKALYPQGKHSFYGITAELDGKPVGIAGVYFNRSWVMFANLTPELKKHKRVIWQGAKELIKAISYLDDPVYAMADKSIPGSERLLLKMGFKQVSKDWYVHAS